MCLTWNILSCKCSTLFPLGIEDMKIHWLLCIIVVCFFLYCLYMEVLQRPKILPLFMLYRTSAWTSPDGTKPITDLIMRIQECALWSFGGCIFWEAHKGLSFLEHKQLSKEVGMEWEAFSRLRLSFWILSETCLGQRRPCWPQTS